MAADISIIMPVLNEQAVINQTIEKLYQQDFSGIFEVVVSDGSRDKATLACIQNQNVIKVDSPPGRGRQMNAGANAAAGEIFLFLHCDTILPQKALEKVKAIMKNASVKAGAFDLAINQKGIVFRMIGKIASLRSRITRLPYGDQAIFIRKTYFFELGRYRNIPIMEDVDLMRRIKRAKGRIQILNSTTSTSARRWKEEGTVYCTLRNWALLTLFLLGANPEKLAAFYKNKTGQ